MKFEDLDPPKHAAVQVHLQAVRELCAARFMTVIASEDEREFASELRHILAARFGEETFDPKRFRVVAIMAEDRKPGDAAQAVEDVVGGNADAARVFDAIGEAFGIRSDGGHVNLDVHIDNDRVSIESWAPPVREETPLQPWNGSPVKPGETIAATAVDIDPRPLAAFSLGQSVFLKYGDQLAGPAKITGITHYEGAETQFLASYITKSGDPQSIWSAERGLLAATAVAEGPKGQAGRFIDEDDRRV